MTPPAPHHPAPDAFSEEIAVAAARQNLSRLRTGALVLVPTLTAHVFYFVLSSAAGMSPAALRWRALQAELMSGIVAATLFLSALAWPAWARRHEAAAPLGWRAHLPLGFAALFVWGSALVTVVDQLVTPAVTPYVTGTLCVALGLRLGVRAGAVLHLVGFLLVESGLLLTVAPSDTRTSSMLNAFTITGVSIALAVTLMRGFVRAQRAARTIAAQEMELQRLRGFLRMCAWCRRVSNEHEEWESLDAYVGRAAEVRITHGMCPDCSTRYLADVDEQP